MDEFLDALLERCPGLEVWPHPGFVIVSKDFASGNAIFATLRLDFDGRRIRGGWSQCFLNGDDGVPANEAGVITAPPQGLDLEGGATELAVAAAAWFERHIARMEQTWPGCSR
jgi:hypothetical protein